MRIKLKDYKNNEIIRIIREWTDLTQEEFGRKIGKSAQTIADYESGKTTYNMKLLRLICEEFHIELIFQKE